MYELEMTEEPCPNIVHERSKRKLKPRLRKLKGKNNFFCLSCGNSYQSLEEVKDNDI